MSQIESHEEAQDVAALVKELETEIARVEALIPKLFGARILSGDAADCALGAQDFLGDMKRVSAAYSAELNRWSDSLRPSGDAEDAADRRWHAGRAV